jgi:hypothetical protein
MTSASAAAVLQDGGESWETESRAWCAEVRERALTRAAPPRVLPPRLLRWAWLLALAVHLLLVVTLRLTLRGPVLRAGDETVMRVELIEPAPAPPQPEPSPRAPAHSVERAAPIVTPKAAPRARPQLTAPTEEMQPRLFNPDGTANVPDDLAARIERDRPRPDFITRQYEPSPLLAAKRPLKVRVNHFAQNWVGTDGMPLHEAMWRHVTFTKEFTAPWGGRYACAWVLVLVACGDIPDKPWNPPQTWKPSFEEH